jgi:hypothetical protein
MMRRAQVAALVSTHLRAGIPVSRCPASLYCDHSASSLTLLLLLGVALHTVTGLGTPNVDFLTKLVKELP